MSMKKDLPPPGETLALCAATVASAPNEDAAALLPAMMRMRGLNPSAVQKFAGADYRSLETTCAQCRDTNACRLWLEAGDGDDPDWCDFCPNARRLGELNALL